MLGKPNKLASLWLKGERREWMGKLSRRQRNNELLFNNCEILKEYSIILGCSLFSI